ncbi:MAG: hypothetical protein MPJ50_15465 [Pirellulales bacterium]|nr:hypothetical protein [Pirellulales bacterium]
MLSTEEAKRAVREFLQNSNPNKQHAGAINAIRQQMMFLMNSSNADVRDALIAEFDAPASYEALVAAQTFLKMFRLDKHAHAAISVFREALESESLERHIEAFTLLYTIPEVPLDLKEAIERHLVEGATCEVAAAMVSTEFDDLRPGACRTLAKLVEQGNISDNSRLLGALRMIRLNFGLEVAWAAVDDVRSRNRDPQFRAGCIDALTGLVPSPGKLTIKRLLVWADEIEATKARAEQTALIALLGNIRRDDAEIDEYLLRQIIPEQFDVVFATTTALTKRGSARVSEAESAVVKLLGQERGAIREAAALCLARCFAHISDETLRVIAAHMRVEPDVRILELLMRVCQQAGRRAFPFLFENWKAPRNLHGWIQTLTLSWLGESSFDEMFQIIVQNPGTESSRLLALMITNVRLHTPGLLKNLAVQFESLNSEELHTVLVALQSAGPNAAFLVPQLLSVATSSDTALADLARGVISSIGVAALPYLPADDDSVEMRRIRERLRLPGQDAPSEIFAGVNRIELQRWATAARLIHDRTSRSLRDVAERMQKERTEERGWSEPNLRRAIKAVDAYLTSVLHQTIRTFDTRGGTSTSPAQLTPEGVRVLVPAERFLESHVTRNA